jgi:hypothetical protein
MFAWDKKIKARKLDADRGQIIGEFSIREILAEPNRYQIEAIIQAMGITGSELIRIEEERQEHIMRGINAVRTSEPRTKA